jgi:hypothetical protein
MQLISGFVDTYLTLTVDEEATFNQEISKIGTAEQEQVMEIVTSWMEKGLVQGLEQGLQKGRREGELKLLLRFLTQRMETLSSLVQAQVRGLTEPQIEQLSDVLPTLTTSDDLAHWLNALETSEGFVGLRAQVLQQLRQRMDEVTPEQKQQLLCLSEAQAQTLRTDSAGFETAQDLERWLEAIVPSTRS